MKDKKKDEGSSSMVAIHQGGRPLVLDMKVAPWTMRCLIISLSAP